MQQILEKLKDDSHYYGEYGKQFISNSDIDCLINNPSAYYDQPEENPNFLFGKAFHELVMFGETELDQYVEASTRNTKIYKEAVAESGKEVLLLAKEYDNLYRCVDSMRNHPVAKELIYEGSPEYEVPMVGDINNWGETPLWKGKADVVNGDFIIDLKTSSTKLSKFSSHARQYDYDSQAYVYESLWQDKKQMMFLVVEKSSSTIGVFKVSRNAYVSGEHKAQLAEQNFLKYIKEKTNPALYNYEGLI
jgi:hypothetical protein